MIIEAARGGAPANGLHLLAAQMSEADLQTAIIQRADRLQLLSYHTHNSRRSRAGFMDLVIAGPHGGVFWELKTEIGKTSVEQDAWLDMMARAGFAAAVRRPSHLLSGQVDRELLAISRHGKRELS